MIKDKIISMSEWIPQKGESQQPVKEDANPFQKRWRNYDLPCHWATSPASIEQAEMEHACFRDLCTQTLLTPVKDAKSNR